MTQRLTLTITTSLAGCRPYGIVFDRLERPVPSMQREYPHFHHPAEHLTATVWVPWEKSIQDVLDYHYPDTWMNLIVEEEEP